MASSRLSRFHAFLTFQRTSGVRRSPPVLLIFGARLLSVWLFLFFSLWEGRSEVPRGSAALQPGVAPPMEFKHTTAMATPGPNSSSSAPSGTAGPAAHQYHPQQSQHITTMSSLQGESEAGWGAPLKVTASTASRGRPLPRKHQLSWLLLFIHKCKEDTAGLSY